MTKEKIVKKVNNIKIDTKEKITDTGKKVKKKLTPSQEQKVIILRFIFFTIFALVLPMVFIGWRYQIFNKVNKVSLSGWGVILLIIAVVFVRYVAKMVRKAEPYSMFSQVTTGVRKVIMPLFILFILLNTIQGDINLFIQALQVTMISEAIAIPINPLPKWAHEHGIEQQENLIGTFIKKLKGKEV